MQWVHEAPSSGHPGIRRSTQLIRRRFWWSSSCGGVRQGMLHMRAGVDQSSTSGGAAGASSDPSTPLVAPVGGLPERLTGLRRLYDVGNVAGHENIVSASRMNSAIVVFLNDVEKVRKLTLNGIVVNNETILVSPLSSPAKKVMLSNVPPFISDEAIGKELSQYGRMVSPIKKIPLGCNTWFLSEEWCLWCLKKVSTLSVLNVVKLDILFEPALRGRVTPVFLSNRGGTQPGPGAVAAPDLTESEPQAQPAAQKPTGATPAPEKPRTAKPAVAEPRSARPDQTGRSRGLLRKAQWVLEQRWSCLC
ncbi:hypothetical protein QTP86_033940 [Hemibagrus guttatus]|nr:hypothetical protein QTP86_033940 [Hemibagrus guttatus]